MAVTVERLIGAGFTPEEIFISTDEPSVCGELVAQCGINVNCRDKRLCENEASIGQWIRETCAQIAPGETIAWAQVCDPLFNQHQACLSLWEREGNRYDSLVVAYRSKRYLMIDTPAGLQPVGWSFGSHHITSQRLNDCFEMPFTFSIMTPEAIEAGYHIGRSPLWYVSESEHIDIDTEEQFEAAAAIFDRRESRLVSGGDHQAEEG